MEAIIQISCLLAYSVVQTIGFNTEDFQIKDESLTTIVSDIELEPTSKMITLKEKDIVESVERESDLSKIQISKMSSDPILYSLDHSFATLLNACIKIGKLTPTWKHYDRCARTASHDCMEILLNHGAKLETNEVLELQRTALLNGNEPVARYLVKRFKVADVRSLAGLRMPKILRDSILDKEYGEITWNRLVKLAAASGDNRSILVILEHIDAASNPRFLKGVLYYAVQSGSVSSVDTLIEAGAKNEMEGGNLPSQIACARGDINMVEALNSHGIDWGQADDLRRSCLHYAVIGENTKVLKRLLELGVDPNLKAKSEREFPAIPFPQYMPGLSALHLASALDKSESIEILVNAGADLDLKTDTRLHETALHITARFRCLKASQTLTRLGADMNITNAEMVSARDAIKESFGN